MDQLEDANSYGQRAHVLFDSPDEKAVAQSFLDSVVRRAEWLETDRQSVAEQVTVVKEAQSQGSGDLVV
jgi:uncharacterized protein (UPF0335 family)